MVSLIEMKKSWLFFIVLILTCVSGSIWFWRLGNISMSDGEGVFVQRIDQQKKAIKEGDTIQTEAESVTISFYGLAETRLAPHSRIKFETISRSTTFGSGIHVDLHLQQGRAWSRVQKLFDSDAAFRVRTDSMTVHVRGTSFDIQTFATGSSVVVLQSSVEMQSMQVQPTILSEGSIRVVDSNGAVLSTSVVNDALYQSEWFKENIHQDQRFDGEKHRRVVRLIDSLGYRSLEGIAASAASLSESVHMLFTSHAHASRLYALYVLRRIAMMNMLACNGKVGLADEAWNAMVRDISAMAQTQDDQYISALHQGMQEGMLLFENTLPGASNYPLKLDVENKYIELHTRNVFIYQYARLMGISTRLDEVEQLIAKSSYLDVRSGLDAARDGIVNVENELEKKDASISQEQMRLLRSTLTIVKIRENVLRIQLNMAEQSSTSTVLSP